MDAWRGPLNAQNSLKGNIDLGYLIEKYGTKEGCYEDAYLIDLYSLGCFHRRSHPVQDRLWHPIDINASNLLSGLPCNTKKEHA